MLTSSRPPRPLAADGPIIGMLVMFVHQWMPEPARPTTSWDPAATSSSALLVAALLPVRHSCQQPSMKPSGAGWLGWCSNPASSRSRSTSVPVPAGITGLALGRGWGAVAGR